MSGTESSIWVAVTEGEVTLRIEGRANCNRSCDFKAAVEELARRGHARFILELSGCLSMDSTFIGVLAGLALEPQETGRTSSAIRFELRNANSRVKELVENLGVEGLFDLVESPETAGDRSKTAPSDAVETATPGGEFSKEDLCRESLRAHEMLMKFNSKNEARFKDVTRFLAEDLKRMEAARTSNRVEAPASESLPAEQG